jgi:predicted metalloendopeptidase
LNFYSIAQFVRELLEWFMEFVEGCEGDALHELQELFAHWATIRKETRLTLKDYMRQLLTIVQHLPGKNRLIVVYNQNYSPFWVLRV